jgi:pimeloyl-ACP methyl ester carboxylesterase
MGKRIAFWAAGLIVVAALGFWLIYIPMEVSKAQRYPLKATPATMGLTYKDVAFPTKGGGLTIRAWWMKAPDARAVLVFVHGANSTREEVHTRGLAIAKFLVGQHISVLALDLRNHGMSDATPSGRLTLGWDEANDAIGAIDYATAQAPGLPVYLMGVSMGGATSIYAAARDPRVMKLVLIDPVLNSHVTTFKALHAILGWPNWLLGPVTWSAETFFAGDPAHHVPLQTAEALKLPILLIEDDGDLVCPPEFAYGLAKHHANVSLWAAHDPGPENPVMKRAGGWGGHASAYRFHPQEMQKQLAAFLVK